MWTGGLIGFGLGVVVTLVVVRLNQAAAMADDAMQLRKDWEPKPPTIVKVVTISRYSNN